MINIRVTKGHSPAQAQKEPAGWGGEGGLFSLLSGVTEIFLHNKVKILNSIGLAGGFVMGCAKKSWF